MWSILHDILSNFDGINDPYKAIYLFIQIIIYEVFAYKWKKKC